MEEGLAKGREEGLAKGREEGLSKGRSEGIALVATAMYAKGMDIDTIASMVGMTKDEVERLCRHYTLKQRDIHSKHRVFIPPL